ncbi:oxygen-regulated protein 1-like [Aquarana catesbeiana]|uniref:oxygen-regulated protein 1-like n=1 Tax=Aquarana catesbeiana TaxID=8400 RepID=UPI003CC9FA1A
MCLTERWPHSGEEIPIISPGDNIEKTVHLNSDGTMTVEMKVCFKIRQEETINWSTTVSRADISYYKKRLFRSSVNPENEAVSIRDSPTRSPFLDDKIHDECKDSMEFRYESHVEEQIDNDVNTNEGKTLSSRKEKSNFYRPPTPGIRKNQERRASMRRTSEGNLQEHMKQMFTYQEIEHETAQSVYGIKNDCNTQMLTADNVDSSGADLSQNSIDHNNAKHLSKLREGSFEMLESTVMELSQRDTVYEKDVRKSLRSDYMCISGSSKQERPSSAGKHIYQQEQFRFKEIKRSMSTSVTCAEPSTLNGNTKYMNKDFGDTNKECLDKGGAEHSAMLMENVPANKDLTATHNSLCQPPSTLGDKTDRGSENETCASNDSYCAPSLKQKKKKKKKIAVDQENIPKSNSMALDSQNIRTQHLMDEGSYREVNPEAKNIMFEDIFPPSVPSNQPELRKLKGDKKMAKVKPSSVKTHNELLSTPTENCKEIKQENTQAEIDLCADCGGINVSNCSVLYIQDQLQCSPTQDSFVPEVQLPKMNSKTSKRSQKTTKKQKNPKKKTKNNKTVNGKMASDSNSLESENVDSAILPAVLESYVQNWLKNIFPNAAFPLLQMISSTKLDNNTVCVNTGTCTQTHVNSGDAGSNANSSETHNDDGKSVIDRSRKDPDHKGIHEVKESLVEHPESFEDNVSVFMEKSKDIAELVAQSFDEFQHNNSYNNCTFEELFKQLASHQIMSLEQKKTSSDVAIQVENDTIKKVSTNCTNGDYKEDVLKEQFNLCPQNINRSKKRHIEKSASLPNTPLKASPSSSPQRLLAWLIVLHLKQGMYHMVEDLSQSTNNFSAIFTLLQSLKKIAITENADDLKAAILHLQESAVRFDTAMKTLPDDFIPTQEYPKDSEESVQVNYTDADNTTSTQLIITESCEKPDLLRNDGDCCVLTDDMDDFRFFSTIPYRELSGEFCRNEVNDNPEDCSLLGMHNNLNNKSASSLDNVDQALVTDRQNSEEHPVDLSEKPSLKSDVVNGNVNMERSSASPKMVSKVKMMVQEMEQKKYSFCGSEYPKSLQSPMSSDWSDYRQDSEESDTLRASSEIMTESGEELIHEKPFKTGFVKRTIERLYGKTETKIILPKTYVSPSAAVHIQSKQLASNDNAEYISSSQKHQCLSKESMSRSLSSPTKKIEDGSNSLKSLSVPLLEDNNNHDCLISQKPNKGEVLIEKGRWLLKENHLVRRSPPEASGMYGNLDTTSADTLLDNTSDDVPYLHPACKVSQPLAEVSSSELEDMAKPQTYTCHYFSMPHGSDSEPFNDTHSSKSKVRPKSSGGFVKSKTNYSLESVEKCGAIRGSLPSFNTVDFNFSDNRVHPLPQSDLEKADNAQKPNSSCESRRQIQEQDSLDKLQLVCGQHCPILTALINHVNEKDRGFVYCSPYDIENQMLQSLLTDTTHSNLLKNYAYTDENNNIHKMNFIKPMKSHNDSYTNIFFIFDINNFAGINLLRNGSKDRQCLLNLYPVSWSAGLDSNENDENNNNLYCST